MAASSLPPFLRPPPGASHGPGAGRAPRLGGAGGALRGRGPGLGQRSGRLRERRLLPGLTRGVLHGDGVVAGEPGGRRRGGDRGHVRRRRGLRDPGGGEAQSPAAARLPAAGRGLAARRLDRGQLQVDRLGAGAGVRGRIRAPEEGVRDLPRQQEQRGGLHGEEGGQAGQGEQAAACRAAGSPPLPPRPASRESCGEECDGFPFPRKAGCWGGGTWPHATLVSRQGVAKVRL